MSTADDLPPTGCRGGAADADNLTHHDRQLKATASALTTIERRQFVCPKHGPFWKQVVAAKPVARCKSCNREEAEADPKSQGGPKYTAIPKEEERGRGLFRCPSCGHTWTSNTACRGLHQYCQNEHCDAAEREIGAFPAEIREPLPPRPYFRKRRPMDAVPENGVSEGGDFGGGGGGGDFGGGGGFGDGGGGGGGGGGGRIGQRRPLVLGLRDGRAQAAGVDHPRVDREHGADALGEDVDDQRLGRVVGRLVAEPPLARRARQRHHRRRQPRARQREPERRLAGALQWEQLRDGRVMTESDMKVCTYV